MTVDNLMSSAIEETSPNASNLCSPYVYVGALLTVYAFAFLPSKLGWHQDIEFDSSYNFLLFSYVLAFAFGHILSLLFKTERSGAGGFAVQDRDEATVTKRLLALYALASLFLSFAIYKLGTFALIADDPLIRSTGNRLGGYIDYQAELLMPLALVSFYLFLKTGKRIFLIPVGFYFPLCVLILAWFIGL